MYFKINHYYANILFARKGGSWILYEENYFVTRAPAHAEKSLNKYGRRKQVQANLTLSFVL